MVSDIRFYALGKKGKELYAYDRVKKSVFLHGIQSSTDDGYSEPPQEASSTGHFWKYNTTLISINHSVLSNNIVIVLTVIERR